MEYLVTYYIKNMSESKEIFNIISYMSAVLTGSEDEVLGIVASRLKKYPYLRCCSIMERPSAEHKVFNMKYMLDNPHYDEVSVPEILRPQDNKEFRELDDDGEVGDEMELVDDERKGVVVKLEQEEKVIGLGAYYHALKGVLIAEATEEDKEIYNCGRFMTFPIVDESWNVREDECIAGGIEWLTVGKKGDTLPLIAVKLAADYNAREGCCGYDELLVDLEQQGITLSNRKAYDSAEEFSDTIVIGIEKIPGEHHFRLDAHEGGYYIPRRFFHVGSDDELYQDTEEGKEQTENTSDRIVEQVAEDVHALSWFFNKPNLKVLVTSITENNLGFAPNEYGSIDKSWFYTVQTLEADINRRLDQYYKEYPNDYYKGKRPDLMNYKEIAKRVLVKYNVIGLGEEDEQQMLLEIPVEVYDKLQGYVADKELLDEDFLSTEMPKLHAKVIEGIRSDTLYKLHKNHPEDKDGKIDCKPTDNDLPANFYQCSDEELEYEIDLENND